MKTWDILALALMTLCLSWGLSCEGTGGGQSDNDRDQVETDTDNPADLADEEPIEEEAAWALPYVVPDHKGHYRVGARRTVFVGQNGERELPGVIWYPTEDRTGEPFYYMELLPDDKVFDSATIAGHGPFPVVIFSHGNQSFAEQSTYLMEHLAGHGFVTAACEHVGNTLSTFDGTKLGYVAQQRPRDLSLVLDELTRMNDDPADPLFGKLNLDAVAIVGHSFGGTTALYIGGAHLTPGAFDAYCGPMGTQTAGTFCALFTAEHMTQIDYDLDLRDPRIKAIVPQTPAVAGLFGMAGLAFLAIPVLLEAGDQDGTLRYTDEIPPAYSALHAPRFVLTLKDAGHFTFSDMCGISPNYGDGCGSEFLSPDTALPLINTYTLAFLRLYLLGEERDRSYLENDYAALHPAVEWQADP